MEIIWLVLLLSTFGYSQAVPDSEGRLCARKTLNNHADRDPLKRSVVDELENCSALNFCYTLWEETTPGNITIIGQGCWEASSKRECMQPTCNAYRKPAAARNTTRFCCCYGNLCNLNNTDMYVAPTPDYKNPQPELSDRRTWQQHHGTLIAVLVCAFTLLCVCVIMVVMYKRWRICGIGNSKSSPDSVHLMENGSPGSLCCALDNLKLTSIVGQGRFGCVWKGSIDDQEVAVKIFPSHYRQYFHNERDIYCLPFMDNLALLTYYGCDERVNLDGCIEYLLVLSYAPNGSLQDFLRNNVIEWSVFCKMALTVAKGLAHLHTDFHKGDKLKPCVSHRDLNTRNILVKADLSCCICDLGLAMKISGSKYYYNGEEQHAETKSINDVGTLRYMAPEVLEGAVNLRDCESSLKQIDIYALGLVLWELSTRCTDLYHSGSDLLPYRLPFEAEVGQHPSFEQMQVLVSRHKARPLFPENWRDSAAVKVLKETVEDCWDQDAEARLTALCVEERLQELPVLWERQRANIYVSGVSPTVNPTNGQNQTVGNFRTNNNNNINNCGSMLGSNILSEGTGCSVRSASQGSANFSKDTNDSTVSEGTVETLVTMSPSEPHVTSYKNSNHTAVTNCRGYGLSQGPLQPYQGRNPCMERNLMLATPSEEELSCNGNTLVDRSFKHATDPYMALESQALVAHDFLSLSAVRPATPIPYVQNAVYDTESPYTTIPKQPNIPGNGSDPPPAKSRRWSSWSGWKKLFFGGSQSKENSFIPTKDNDIVETEDAKSNLLVKQNIVGISPVIMETQVCLQSSAKSGSNLNKNGVVTSVMPSLISPKKDKTEEISSENESLKFVKHQRPSTLPLVSIKPAPNNNSGSVNVSRQSLEEQFQRVFGSKNDVNGSRLKDPHSRVKTPGDVPPSVRRNRGKGNAARFSLYDDRMMYGNYNKTLPENEVYEIKECNGHSLSNSVPSNIDVSCKCGSRHNRKSSTSSYSFQLKDGISSSF